MRIIHCADLHLDAKMNTVLSAGQADERRGELLMTFRRMTAYAQKNSVSAILISGDLFDAKRISAQARNTVYETIQACSDILFYYLPGNHEKEGFIEQLPELPENLRIFTDTWRTYEESGISFSGLVLTRENADTAANQLHLQPEKINIVMLHGQAAEYGHAGHAEYIDLGKLQNRYVDYLALGHVHQYKEGKLDERGIWCYPGCLEGRGFDECGIHGFVVMDIDPEKHRIIHRFIPFARRTLYEREVDVSGCTTTLQMEERVENAVMEPAEKDLVKVILRGELDVTVEKNTAHLLQMLQQRFYAARLEDRTTLRVDYRTYALDASLKGEFVRVVEAETQLSEEEKAEIIRCGLQALTGER
ncbi:MAG: metallophosphoesterase [Eubacteriales bacterium]|nr:metallophosphoesterase [Eubacteriales bacterium]